MIEWIVSSSVLILVAVGLGWALREHLSARLRYALWAVVLVRLLCPVSWGESPLSLETHLRELPTVQDVEVLRGVKNLHYDQGSGMVYAYGGILYDQPQVVAESATEQEFRRMEMVLTAREVLMPLWLWGMAAMALVFLLANRRFEEQADRDAREIETDCGVNVYVTEGVETPCLFGIVVPVIYVTPEVAADETLLRHCLAHEETHRRHGDHIWSALRCLCLVLHWYNPLVWLAAVLSRCHSELACDEGTLLRLGEKERFAYGRTLIALTAEGPGGLMAAVTTMTGGKRSLAERVTRIAKGTKTAYFAMRLAVFVMVLAAGCAFTGAVGPDGGGEVRLGEIKSAAGESYYTVEAELPLYTGEDADPGLWKKLEDNWRSWDAMSEMSQMLSNTLPGSCGRECDTWWECGEYLGVELDNPLEEDWTFANESAIPLDTPVLQGNGHHARVSFRGTREGTLEGVQIKAGYLDGDVRLAMTAYLRCTGESLAHRCLWAERVTFETETLPLADGMEVLLVTPEDSGNYCSADAYFVRDGALYSLHAVGEKGAEDQVRTALEAALAKFGA